VYHRFEVGCVAYADSERVSLTKIPKYYRVAILNIDGFPV